jgi:mono/diheme cytochrome c family protein
MKRWVKAGLGLVVGGTGLVAIAGVGGYVWATSARDAVLGKIWTLPHQADFPIPFPLSDAELDELTAHQVVVENRQGVVTTSIATADPAAPAAPGLDVAAIARDRAIARGKHLVESRLGCAECHGPNFAGGTMIDAPAMGTLKGPNITSGGVTKGWGAADWDRIVRHGLMEDGHAAIMPAEDFAMLSDRELSDVITYIQSVPPSEAVIPAPNYGPVFTVLLAAGQIHPAAYVIDHTATPPRFPPDDAANAEYGHHLAQSCSGCHGHDLNGGPIKGGDPSWPPAANLTPAGLQGWTFADFDQALRHGQKKEGGAIRKPMPWQGYSHMTDTEAQAIWAYLQTLPPTPTGT